MLPNKPRGVARVNDRRVLTGIFCITSQPQSEHGERLILKRRTNSRASAVLTQVAQPKADPLICQRTKIDSNDTDGLRANTISGEKSLIYDQRACHVLLRATFAVILLVNATIPILAQDGAKTTAEKWRPKNGVYASPGKDFIASCGESAYLVVELAKKRIEGNEWGCDITKITDTAPGDIKVDMTCNDYNLAEYINAKDPNPDERKFKEIMLLRKIDEKSMFVRKTVNAKFKDRDWRAAYCPADAQRGYTEAGARDMAEAEQKAEQRSKPKPWLPRNGIYAVPGNGFNDRCLKSGDAIIDLSQDSLANGADKCRVLTVWETKLPGTITLDLICNERAQGLDARDFRYPVLGVQETMSLKKMDDKTVLLQKIQNGQPTEPGKQLSYCGDEAQRMFAQQRAKK